MTTANKKVTRTYDIIDGPSREKLFLQLQMMGCSDIADNVKPLVFEVNNNLQFMENGHRYVIPGRVDVYIDGVDILSDINGHRDGDVVRLRGKIVNDSSFSDVNGRFEAVYDTHHRGRKINHRFHCKEFCLLAPTSLMPLTSVGGIFLGSLLLCFIVCYNGGSNKGAY